ncbi:GDSL-type esterase/lipase family protein [Sunxiuqinia sp. sy24]|uniref:GDSL-type esterase/lipase family protein n=1 Tax=Sunxiuqinia sp. sy24 TaxID=3461495 RepID=UPI004045A69A
MVRITSFLMLMGLLVGCQPAEEEVQNKKPTGYIIGDSTVKNGRGDGADGLWGWGDPLAQYFDTTKIRVENHALGGTSSRTFRTQGLWDEVLRNLQAGDYVLIQFGHNDADPVNDDFRTRGTFEGISDKMEEIDNLLTGEHKVVHTYGWYIRQYIIDAKERGAIPVVLSPIPRNRWVNGEVVRNDATYGEWAREVATFEEVEFIDLNEKMALAMEAVGEDSVTGNYFFKHDQTHTSAQGAVFAASLVVEGLNESTICKLKDYLLEAPRILFPVKRNVFFFEDSNVARGDGKVVGWARELPVYLDTSRLDILNPCHSPHNGWNYYSQAHWSEVLEQMNEDDFLLIQLGQREKVGSEQTQYLSPEPESGGEPQQESGENGTKETNHSYPKFLEEYIKDAKNKGVSVILISPLLHNEWSGGMVKRVGDTSGQWAREVAEAENVFFIDLNNSIALEYEAMGPEIVNQFFGDNSNYSNEAGARLNALILAKEIKKLRSCALSGYVNLN